VAHASDFRSITGRASSHDRRGALAVGGRPWSASVKCPNPSRSGAGWRKEAPGSRAVRGPGDQIVGALALEDEIRPEPRRRCRTPAARQAVVIDHEATPARSPYTVGRELGVDQADGRSPARGGRPTRWWSCRPAAYPGHGRGRRSTTPRPSPGPMWASAIAPVLTSPSNRRRILVSNDPRAVVSLIRLSIASYRKMIQNLAWPGPGCATPGPRPPAVIRARAGPRRRLRLEP